MKRIAAVLAALAFVAPALAAEDGAALYAQKCVACHGKDGKGTPTGKKMGAPDLTATKVSDKETVDAITNGKGKMSGYKGKLTPEQIDAVAKYVKSGLK